MDALKKELGIVDMIRFLQLFDPGEGDYTRDREKLLAGITMDDITRELEEMRQRRQE